MRSLGCESKAKLLLLEIEEEERHFNFFHRILLAVSSPFITPLSHQWQLQRWLELDKNLSFITETYVLPFNSSAGEPCAINPFSNLLPIFTAGLILSFFPNILQYEVFTSLLNFRKPILCFPADLMLFSLEFCHIVYYMSSSLPSYMKFWS